MLTSRAGQTLYLSLAVSSFAAALTPAAATTMTLTPQIRDYFDPTESNNYQLNNIGPGQSTTAFVGRIIDSAPSVNGDYAVTIEFLIPNVPGDALITNLSLKVTAFGGRLHDVQLRTYFAPNTAPDPARIFAGSNLTNYYRQDTGVVTTDLTYSAAATYIYDYPGMYLGFSFRETNPRDPRYCSTIGCGSLDVLGSNSAPDLYTLPVLSLTYDVPTPPAPPGAVPEPASLLLLGAGLLAMGMIKRPRMGQAAFTSILPTMEHMR